MLRNLKNDISCHPVLAKFNTKYKKLVSADTSAYASEGCWSNYKTMDRWRPVVYCSKSLSEAERADAQIEKEALGIVWTQYLLGSKFDVRTYHKPLTSILVTKSIHKLSSRQFHFNIE